MRKRNNNMRNLLAFPSSSISKARIELGWKKVESQMSSSMLTFLQYVLENVFLVYQREPRPSLQVLLCYFIFQHIIFFSFCQFQQILNIEFLKVSLSLTKQPRQITLSRLLEV